MNKNLILTIFCVLAVSIVPTMAQVNLYKKAKIEAIDANTLLFEKLRLENAQFVDQLSKKLKIDIRRTLGGGRVMELKGINEIGEPIFTISESNLQAGQTTFTNSIYDGGKLGVNISGSGQYTQGRLGVWDGGKVLNSHVEFGGRITQIDNSSSTSSHSTHVAGTMIASGVNAIAKGMAPSANLKAWDYNNDDAEMSAASKELVVSNHSYGQVAGWVYNDTRTGDQKWEWYGNTQISEYEDYKFGFYDSQSQSWDKIAFLAPNYLIVKSAGNKGDETGPGLNPKDSTKTLEKYYLGSGQDTSYVARSQNDKYDNLPTYSVAKNILTVGAVSIVPNGPSLASDIKISSFSSWGPTDDGRIKPDIVGAGVNLFSTTDVSNSSYTFLSGTSMSSPQISGSIFLLQDLYSQLNKGTLMRSSTLKGLVLHTATDAGNTGPDYIFGWGLLNMQKAASVILNKENTTNLEEKSLNTNEVFTKKVVANGKEPLVVTICWTDPEGTPTSASASNLNSRLPKLINDLDASVSDGKSTFQAWVLDPNNPSKLATKGDNYRDNVEQVYISNPIPGKEYTISISHKSALKNGLQDYALVVSGIGGKAYCVASPTANDGTKIEKLVVNNNTYTAKAGCAGYVDNTGFAIEVTPNQKVDIDLTMGTCSINKEKIYTVFADWNIDGDFDDLGEKLIENTTLTLLQNFKNNFVVPSTINPGGTTRLRIIVSEDSQISSCGNYSKGETSDFTLNYISPKNDLAITDLIYPTTSICANSVIENVTLNISNKGTNAINNGTIIVIVYENGTKILEQQSQINKAIPALSNTRLSLPISVPIKPKATYSFEINGQITNEENPENNAIKIERSVQTDVLSEGAKAVGCSNDKTVTLISNGQGAAFWYDAATGGNLLAIGNNISYTKPATPTLFYASQNDLQGVIGPKSKKEFAGGTYSGNFGPKPLISTKAPMQLESARLYIGHSGKIIFTVERISDLTPVSTVTLDVVSTRNAALGNAANGQQLDDVNDAGAVYNLGLEIPEPGDYQISIDYQDGASIFRSNSGVAGFPFSLQNTVTIKGSSFNSSTLTSAWYYFYNLKVKSLGCASTTRTLAQTSSAINSTATIKANGATELCPSSNVTLVTDLVQTNKYQWYKDSVAISNANKNTLVVTQKGKYYLQISDGGVCPTASNSITINAKSPIAPTISTTANLLTASGAQSFQWLLSRQPIVGATSNTYSAFQTGSYSVIGKVDGCDIQSAEVYVTILGDEVVKNDEPIIVFPNPTTEVLKIEGSELMGNKSIQFNLFNAIGSKVKSGNLNKSESNNQYLLQTTDLNSGQYLLWIQVGEKRFLKKFIKH
jgi:Subtilase family/GEVED domain/Secretion system C-terminal sorting domain